MEGVPRKEGRKEKVTAPNVPDTVQQSIVDSSRRESARAKFSRLGVRWPVTNEMQKKYVAATLLRMTFNQIRIADHMRSNAGPRCE